MRLKFFVPGTPVPKGSAKGFVVKNKATGKMRAIVVQDNKERQKPWASMIGLLASQCYKGALLSGPVSLSLQFVMPRLKGHYGSGKNADVLKAGAPYWHISKPDTDKLIRCVKDALTGVVWGDDSQVCRMDFILKVYGDKPGVHIEINSI
jgi:Holliday junction resolvase RusA-like endonuclease